MNIADIDLIELVNRTHKITEVARTSGGTAHGACPKCGGTDRFYVRRLVDKIGRGQFACSHCHFYGDAIDWVRYKHGYSYVEALEYLNLPASETTSTVEYDREPEPPLDPPGAAWQEQAEALVSRCVELLWSPEGARALAYLRGRGLSDETIATAQLGYNPEESWQTRSDWGLEADDNKTIQRFKLHRGIVIPWRIDGVLWKVEFRRPVSPDDWSVPASAALKTTGWDVTGAVFKMLRSVAFMNAARLAKTTGYTLAQVEEALDWLKEQRLIERPAKYLPIPGSPNCVYGIDTIKPGQPVAIVEGALNALSVRQEASEVTAVVAVGAATHGRRVRWLSRLGLARPALVALDNDSDPEKGDAHAAYWIDALAPLAIRWRPTRKDCNQMLSEGAPLRAWVEAGIECASQHLAPVAVEQAAPWREVFPAARRIEDGRAVPDPIAPVEPNPEPRCRECQGPLLLPQDASGLCAVCDPERYDAYALQTPEEAEAGFKPIREVQALTILDLYDQALDAQIPAGSGADHIIINSIPIYRGYSNGVVKWVGIEPKS